MESSNLSLASDELSTIFRELRHQTTSATAICVEQAVGLLLQFPGLARKTYFTKRAPTPRYPLFILAESGATLEQIKSVYNFYSTPQAKEELVRVNHAMYSRILPKPELLQVMEGGKATLGVLSFLVLECPTLLKHKDALGGLAVHKFFRRWRYGFYEEEIPPQCDELGFCMIEKFQDCCDLDLFQLAFHVSASDKIVDLILKNLLQKTDLGNFNFHGVCLSQSGFPYELSLRDATAISKVLPKLWGFSFDPLPGGATPDGFRCLIDSVNKAKNLRMLSLALDSEFLHDHEQERFLFLQMLASSCFEDLALKMSKKSVNSLLDDMVQALRYRTKALNTLTLKQFTLSSVTSIRSLLASKVAKSLRLEKFHFCFDSDEPPSRLCNSQACLENLEVVGCFISVAELGAMLKQIGSSSSLKRLVIRRLDHSCSLGDATEHVLALLKESKSLEELELPPYMAIKLSSICEALKDNNTLSSFSFGASREGAETNQNEAQCIIKMLACNVTLKTLDCALGNYHSTLSRQIQYYLQLNRNGRRKARDLETSKAAFVQILANTLNDNNPLVDVPTIRRTGHVPGELSLLYGLLRENPTVWSAQKHSFMGKRKMTDQEFDANSPAWKRKRSYAFICH